MAPLFASILMIFDSLNTLRFRAGEPLKTVHLMSWRCLAEAKTVPLALVFSEGGQVGAIGPYLTMSLAFLRGL
ncbi:hypothetical protein ABAC402_16660 [Asticcacaulis sp. AC402]|nr:hypothetical protein ABAC402_16660 [Asticcacaulis sp. AC402]